MSPSVDEGRLEGGADEVETVVGHGRGHDLQAHGQAVFGLRYIAIGSSPFSPLRNAVVGAVGETRTSAFSNAAAKSRVISVRTFWAWP